MQIGQNDKAVIESALLKSPSGGNSKPFKWDWSDSVIHVKLHAENAEHYLNRNEHTSWIALGCLIESVEVAAQGRGCISQVEIFENPIAARITFLKTGTAQESDPETKTLLGRYTYRGPFRPSAAPVLPTRTDEVFLKIRSTQPASPKFFNYLSDAENYLWKQRKVTDALFGELRFFDKEFFKKGIRSGDLGATKPEEFMIFIFSYFRWMPRLFLMIPFIKSGFLVARRRNTKNAHFILFAAADMRPVTLLRVGKVGMKTWLLLEKQGYVSQPYSLPTIPVVDSATGFLPEDTTPEFRKLFGATGPAVFKEEFNLSANEKPIWMFRTGKK